jgi:hypothetical protein
MGNLFNGNFGSTTPDKLFADTLHPVDIKAVTLKSGQGILARGTVLGITTMSLQLGAVTPAPENTGNGTVTSTSLGTGARLGTYTLTCITEASGGGTFSVVGPGGSLPNATVGTPYTGQVNFTINDGSEDWDTGDVITIVVQNNASGGKALKVDSSKSDGSEDADCVLTDTIDTTDGDVVTTAYKTGSFNRKALVFGGTDSPETHELHLRELGIYIKDVQDYDQE